MKKPRKDKCSKCNESLQNKSYRQSFKEDKSNYLTYTLTCHECIEKEGKINELSRM